MRLISSESLTFQNVLTNIFLVLRCYIDVFNAAPLPLLPSLTFENVWTKNFLVFKCFVLFFLLVNLTFFLVSFQEGEEHKRGRRSGVGYQNFTNSLMELGGAEIQD